MYNLLMQGIEWDDEEDTVDTGRVFEHTAHELIGKFGTKSDPDFDKLKEYPCLFMQEGDDEEKVPRVGYIFEVVTSGRYYHIAYRLDRGIVVPNNSDIFRNRLAFGIVHPLEFSRTHWAVKDVDLYRAILKTNPTTVVGRRGPKVFSVSPKDKIRDNLVSVMMPFDSSMRPVFDSIKAMASAIGMDCQRGDDIWNDDKIIQDVVHLIDESRIVICDCTGKNPNVFYETGIAHSLGRDVILITQNSADIPFDVGHLRHIKYLNNNEGRVDLCEKMKSRIDTIVSV